jgi:hypothetical protein
LTWFGAHPLFTPRERWPNEPNRTEPVAGCVALRRGLATGHTEFVDPQCMGCCDGWVCLHGVPPQGGCPRGSPRRGGVRFGGGVGLCRGTRSKTLCQTHPGDHGGYARWGVRCVCASGPEIQNSLPNRGNRPDAYCVLRVCVFGARAFCSRERLSGHMAH